MPPAPPPDPDSRSRARQRPTAPAGDPGALLDPGDFLGTRGFSIYGGIVFGGLAAALALRKSGRPLPYLDMLAAGFPLGLAVGRIGDVINGEHFGARLPWAIQYTHPDAEVPSADVAYHPGGLYEVALGLALLAIVWPLRHRLQRPGTLLWSVIGLYAAGRFLMFFYRSDSPDLALDLNGTQWLSLALATVATAGLACAFRAPANLTEDI